jgi:hypothetical protein
VSVAAKCVVVLEPDLDPSDTSVVSRQTQIPAEF